METKVYNGVKVITLLLFIIFITYSNAIDFQSITLGADSPKDLRTSVNDDYFYFKKIYVNHHQKNQKIN